MHRRPNNYWNLPGCSIELPKQEEHNSKTTKCLWSIQRHFVVSRGGVTPPLLHIVLLTVLTTARAREYRRGLKTRAFQPCKVFPRISLHIPIHLSPYSWWNIG